MAATADHRLQQLETVEREISTALQSAGQALSELAREKPVNKQLEAHTSHFLKTLETVESNLSKHIMYLSQVSTSQPHEGSSYAAQKNLQMAQHRLEHIRSCVNELDRISAEHARARHQQALRRSLAHQAGGMTTDGDVSQQRVHPQDASQMMSQQQQQQLQHQQQQYQQQQLQQPGLQRAYSQDPN